MDQIVVLVHLVAASYFFIPLFYHFILFFQNHKIYELNQWIRLKIIRFLTNQLNHKNKGKLTLLLETIGTNIGYYEIN